MNLQEDSSRNSRSMESYSVRKKHERTTSGIGKRKIGKRMTIVWVDRWKEKIGGQSRNSCLGWKNLYSCSYPFHNPWSSYALPNVVSLDMDNPFEQNSQKRLNPFSRLCSMKCSDCKDSLQMDNLNKSLRRTDCQCFSLRQRLLRQNLALLEYSQDWIQSLSEDSQNRTNSIGISNRQEKSILQTYRGLHILILLVLIDIPG